MIQDIFVQYALTFGWGITGAITLVVALYLVVKFFEFLSPIDEWKELKAGNMAVAMVYTSVIIGTSLVIALIVAG